VGLRTNGDVQSYLSALAIELIEQCESLVQAGADLKSLPMESRQSLLNGAVWNGKENMVKLLIESGIDVNFRSDGEAAIHCAFNEFRDGVYRSLIAAGANLDIIDESGFSILHHLCDHGDVAAISNLIKDGARTDLADPHGKLPLHIAAFRGQDKVCKALIDAAGADPDAPMVNGLTPLFLAAGLGHTETCFTLIQCGADPDAKHKGKTAWAHASSRQKKDTAAHLKAFAASIRASRAVEKAMEQVLEGINP
jgi:ankyrin repeat protein